MECVVTGNGEGKCLDDSGNLIRAPSKIGGGVELEEDRTGDGSKREREVVCLDGGDDEGDERAEEQKRVRFGDDEDLEETSDGFIFLPAFASLQAIASSIAMARSGGGSGGSVSSTGGIPATNVTATNVSIPANVTLSKEALRAARLAALDKKA